MPGHLVEPTAWLDYRDANGPFGSTDQLQEVAGIGAVTFAKFADLVTV